MWEIWAIQMLSKAFKICSKSNKSPDLVTLIVVQPKLSEFICTFQSAAYDSTAKHTMIGI